MKTFLILASAAAVALSATPALAEKGGHGHKQEWKQGDRHHDSYRDRYRSDRRYGYHSSSYRNCPPGLRKKHNRCMPPGQARRSWREGQRITSNYRYYTPYSQIPQRYRDQYDLDRDNRYIYQNGTIYQVDPTTHIVERILSGLIR